MFKIRPLVWALLCGLCAVTSPAFAAFTSGSTGADGALHVTQDTQLPLPDDGVFNFTTITVDEGATLTFKKNAQNTGVTLLATGNVTIAGTISVSGQPGNYIIPGEGGPGGFDGGVGAAAKQTGRRGEGPGGGYGGTGRSDRTTYAGSGGGGGHAAKGNNGKSSYSEFPGGSGGPAYGNERLLPLLGGSGGGGGGGTSTYVAGAGGGGGGAMVIASSGTISVTGALYANGGKGANGEDVHASYGCNGGGGGGGGGGAIRLIANTISGDGTISAAGGGGVKTYSNVYSGTGSVGRIRLEASTITRTASTTPPMSLGYPYAVTPPDMPSLTIKSIAGVSAPSVPGGDFGAPDITLPYNVTNPVAVIVQAVNIPVNTTVTLKANPAVGSTTSATGALTGTLENSATTIDLNISTAYPSVITAFVTYDLTTALLDPFYINGERVVQMRVAATLGEHANVTYITEGGKEFPASS
nr:hypothetical protein [uncultured Desulfuromonas sp.]